jgi:hypothetical protein
MGGVQRLLLRPQERATCLCQGQWVATGGQARLLGAAIQQNLWLGETWWEGAGEEVCI